MPTAVRDASLVTLRNRNKAQASYYNAWKADTVNSSKPNTALNPPVIGGANLVSDIFDGNVATNVLTNEYAKFASTNGVSLATIRTTLKTLGPDPNVSLYPYNAGVSRNNAF
jgi:hypothetical protein